MFQINTSNSASFYNRQIRNENILFYEWSEKASIVPRVKFPCKID